MSDRDRGELLRTLQRRFEANARRHPEVPWADVAVRLESAGAAWVTLLAMESSGGEPDVIGRDDAGAGFVFCDCAAESPSGRRSLCYDEAALRSRRENRPRGSAVRAAADLGVELLDEAQYRALQRLGEFDLRTSSWIATPADVRQLGGALFCDRRFGKVFTYHNGAESYYAARGFRGLVRV